MTDLCGLTHSLTEGGKEEGTKGKERQEVVSWNVRSRVAKQYSVTVALCTGTHHYGCCLLCLHRHTCTLTDTLCTRFFSFQHACCWFFLCVRLYCLTTSPLLPFQLRIGVVASVSECAVCTSVCVCVTLLSGGRSREGCGLMRHRERDEGGRDGGSKG